MQIKTKIRILVIAIVWVAGLGLASGQEGKYVEILWKQNATPKIDLVEGATPRLILPASLNKAISLYFPGYRLPDNQDYVGDWAVNYPGKLPDATAEITKEKIETLKVPFLTIGDFNGDKIQDVAVLLVAKKDNSIWKLVVFHGFKKDYKPVEVISSPEMRKDDPRKGKNYGPIQKYNLVRHKNDCRNGQVCLGLEVSEAASFQFVWKNSQYTEINLHD